MENMSPHADHEKNSPVQSVTEQPDYEQLLAAQQRQFILWKSMQAARQYQHTLNALREQPAPMPMQAAVAIPPPPFHAAAAVEPKQDEGPSLP